MAASATSIAAKGTASVLSHAATTAFIPRTTFPQLPSLPKSYYLGHHASGLAKMKSLLNQIDLVIECRDARIPLTSRNPTLEHALSANLRGTRVGRIVVYTKRDLVAQRNTPATQRRESLLRAHHAALGDYAVHFHTSVTKDTGRDAAAMRTAHNSAGTLIKMIKQYARERWSLTGLRVLVAGMPNVGKSTLLNSLRARGVGKGKAARTGADPGVTRAVGNVVRIIDGAEIDADEASENDDDGDSSGFFPGMNGRRPSSSDRKAKGQSEGVYVMDTPGVFMPYVPSQSAMLKLALCGSVKDGLVPPITLADYLLFQLNLSESGRATYPLRCLGRPTQTPSTTDNDDSSSSPQPASSGPEEPSPTNDIVDLLTRIGHRTGKLVKGGKGRVDYEGVAVDFVRRWRKGEFNGGDLDRDEVDALRDGAAEKDSSAENDQVSISQARKMWKESQRVKMREKGRAMGYF